MTRHLKDPPRRTEKPAEYRDIAGLCRQYRCTEAELRAALAATGRANAAGSALDAYFQTKRSREVNNG
jgi:hypothetical protein